MKSSQIFLECERFLKRALKDKGRYSKGAVIAFLITGGIGIAVPTAVHAIIPTGLLAAAFKAAGINGYEKVTYENGSVPGTVKLKKEQVAFSGTESDALKQILGAKVSDLGLTLSDLYTLLYHNPLATKSTQFYGFNKQGTLDVNEGYVTYEGSTITGGENTFVNGTGAIALGGNSKASGVGTIALGQYSDASAKATGTVTYTPADSTHPVTEYTYGPSLRDNIAMGFKAESHADYSLALGARSGAGDVGSNAIGFNTQAGGKSSLAIGYNTFANAKASANNNLGSTIGGLTNVVSATTKAKMAEYADKLSEYENYSNALKFAEAHGNDSDAQDARDGMASTETEMNAIRTFLEKQQDYRALMGLSTTDGTNGTELGKALSNGSTTKVSDIINNKLNNGFDYESKTNTLNLDIEKEKIQNPKNESDFKEYTKKDGDNAIAIGNYTSASGNASIAQGVGAHTQADASIALGALAKVEKEAARSVAIGVGSQAHEKNSVAMGVQASTYGQSDVAIGNQATVLKENSIGIGVNTTVLSTSSTALGNKSRIKSNSTAGVAVGREAEIGESSKNSIAIGMMAKVEDKAANSISLGYSAKTKAENSMALGTKAETGLFAAGGLAVGNNSSVQAINSIAVGQGASVRSNSDRSISIGSGAATTGKDAIALGTSTSVTGANTIVIGNAAKAAPASTDTVNKSVDNAVVIGQGAGAQHSNSIVLGKGSNDIYEGWKRRLKPGVGAYDNLPPSAKYEFNTDGSVVLDKVNGMDIPSYLPPDSKMGKVLAEMDQQSLGVVSVGGEATNIDDGAGGKAKALRRIINVAPGALDTDVVTVAQLRDWRAKGVNFLSIENADNHKITEVNTKNAGYAADGTTIENRGSNYNSDQATGKWAMALGPYAKATGETAIGVGYGAGAYGTDSLSLGSASYSGGTNSVAIGTQARAAQGKTGAVAIGQESWSKEENGVALGKYAKVTKADGVALGSNSVADIKKGKTGWDPASDPTGNPTGNPSNPVIERRNRYVDNHDNNKLTGATLTSTLGGVSLGGHYTDQNGHDQIHTRQINYLAAGTEDTDAVNVAQVKALNLKIAGNTTDASKADVRLHDQTLTVKGDGNYITTTANNNTITVGLTQDAINKINAVGNPVHFLATNGSQAANKTVHGVEGVSSNYNNEGAVGTNSVALGVFARSAGNYTVAIGNESGTGKEKSVAVGNNTFANGKRSVALGDAATVNADNKDAAGSWDGTWEGNNAVAIGADAVAKRDQDVAIGKSAIAKGGDGVSIGSNSNTLGENSIAIGSHAKVEDTTTVVRDAEHKTADEQTPTNSIAIGRKAYTNQKETIAMGTSSSVKAKESVAIGQTAKIEAGAIDSVAMGKGATINANASYGTAIGQGATINTGATYGVSIGQGATIGASATYATAIGQGTSVTSADGSALGRGATVSASQGTALGKGATASAEGGVALGSGSVASTASGVNAWDPANGRRNNYGNIRSGVAATSGAGAVSVGSESATRQITNLAGGTQDTDAVNVAQLKAMNLKLAGNTTATTGADVRLSEQTLTVKGTDGYITTNADNNEITVGLTDKAKASLFVTSFSGDAVS